MLCLGIFCPVLIHPPAPYSVTFVLVLYTRVFYITVLHGRSIFRISIQEPWNFFTDSQQRVYMWTLCRLHIIRKLLIRFAHSRLLRIIEHSTNSVEQHAFETICEFLINKIQSWLSILRSSFLIMRSIALRRWAALQGGSPWQGC